jgi:hypothetical protein
MKSYPDRPYSVIGYLDATTAPIRRRGVVAFAARRAKELGAGAIIVAGEGQEYAGSISIANAFTSGNVYASGFNATTFGTAVSRPLLFGNGILNPKSATSPNSQSPMGDLPPSGDICRRPMAHPLLRGRRTKSPYECRFHFQPRVRSVIRAKDRKARPIAQSADPSEDRERNEPNQSGCRLFRRWNADDSEPESIRSGCSLRRQFCCDGRWYWCYFSGHRFSCRRLSLLEILRRTFCCVLPPDFRGHFISRSK